MSTILCSGWSSMGPSYDNKTIVFFCSIGRSYVNIVLTYAMMQREGKDELDVEHGMQRLEFDGTKL